MASASTQRWVSTAPYVTLVANVVDETNEEATIEWELRYTSSSAADTQVQKSYTVELDGTTVLAEGTYNIDGKTGTHVIASDTRIVSKTKSKKNYTLRVEFEFNLTWSGVYGGTYTASVTVAVPAITSYTVSYNANGGTGVPGSQTKWYTETLKLSSTKPTRTGYTFSGWATSSSGSVSYAPGANYTANKSVTLYAVWDPVTYAVTYNANGGTGAPPSDTKKYGVDLTLSQTIPTRSKHNFRGWGTSATTTTVSYQPGAKYTANKAIDLYAIWDLAYARPRINNVSIYRSDSNGNPNDNSDGVTVSFTWVTDYENPSIRIEFINGGQVTHTRNSTGTGVSGTYKSYVRGTEANPISTDKTYTVLITVTDSLGYGDESRTLPGTKYVIDLLAGGNGISFGKPAEHEGYADFGYEMLLNNEKRISGFGLDGSIIEAFQPVNENGNTVIGWGNYEKSRELTSSGRLAKTNGYTNIYGHDINFGVANVPTPITFRPYYSRRDNGEDAVTLSIKTAGYVTNGGTEVSFMIPLSKPIIGNPSVTVTTRNGFVLRQNTKYTHGSTDKTYTHPDTYTVSDVMEYGVYVTAKFSDTTNVVNNAPIGIYWNGTITFS